MRELIYRPRRLRKSEGIRRMVRENEVRPADLVYPIFVTHGTGVKEEVPSLPGVFDQSIDEALKDVGEAVRLGVPAVIVFGLPEDKDEYGSEAYAEDGIVQQALRALKDEYPELVLIADTCLCQYTSHGHCGVVVDGQVKNDPSLELLARTAVSQAKAGADIVAPSDMMDGRVGAIRDALDEEGLTDTVIMSYAAKYASAFYGPFRDAANSAPAFGDRKTYQMDPPNGLEALREVELDIDEGADIVMVKPALAYLDVIRMVRDSFNLPVAAYNVSGEYAMIKAAAQRGWINERQVALEALTGMKRAGASIILTYFAKDVCRWLAG